MKTAPPGWKFVDKPYRPIESRNGCKWAYGIYIGGAGDSGPGTFRVGHDADVRWLAPDDTPEPRRWEADDGSGWWEECFMPWGGAVDGWAPVMILKGTPVLDTSDTLGRDEAWVRWVPKETP